MRQTTQQHMTRSDHGKDQSRSTTTNKPTRDARRMKRCMNKVERS
jgi:hypothetical protein